MLIGLVGKPSSGKSSFFSAATLVDVAIASYPFTTIEPNRGIGFVRIDCVDTEFNTQCNPRTGFCKNHVRYVPIELIDVAGLVPGAHEGKGLGNKFLDDLRQADVLIHVVDVSGSTNEKGEMVPVGSHDPAKDIGFLEEEINLWFLGVLQKNWPKMGRIPISGKQQLLNLFTENLSGLSIKEWQIEKALMHLNLIEKKLNVWTEQDLKDFAVELRKKSKPIVIAANKIDLPGADKKFEALKATFPDLSIVACSAQAELALKKATKEGFIEYYAGTKDFAIKQEKKMNENQAKAMEYIRKTVLEKFGSTGIQEVLENAVFNQLKMIAIFPGGVNKLQDSEGRVLPDCFLMPVGSTALDFAFRLHSDIGNGFINAIDVRTKTMVGKTHELKNRDVIEINFKKR
jgi:ribosome-binding ATPase YchF (GTP1/OBG family)